MVFHLYYAWENCHLSTNEVKIYESWGIAALTICKKKKKKFRFMLYRVDKENTALLVNILYHYTNYMFTVVLVYYVMSLKINICRLYTLHLCISH